MKNLVVTFILLSSVFLVQGQNTGTIAYTVTTKFNLHFEGDQPPPPGFPTENKEYFNLYFNEAASLYAPDEDKNNAQDIDQETGDGGKMVIRMDVPELRIYTDITNNKTIRQEDFMQRKFLIESDLKPKTWKLTGKQKMIAGYPCQEAELTDTVEHVIAYFTPAIPVSIGPVLFNGLPGLVMEVNINEGEQLITATTVDKTVDETKIEKPKEGKKVTQEEFDEIVKEKMEEMGVDGDGGQRVIIKINDN